MVKEMALLPSGSPKQPLLTLRTEPGAQLVKDSIFLILLQVLTEPVMDELWNSRVLVVFIALIN